MKKPLNQLALKQNSPTLIYSPPSQFEPNYAKTYKYFHFLLIPIARGFWKNIENRKSVLNQLALRFNIKEPHEWGVITVKKLKEQGAGSALKIFNFSMEKLLKETYPGKKLIPIFLQ